MACNDDFYQPDPPDTATCPYCGAQVPSLPADAPYFLQVAFFYRCPACRLEWCENRRRGQCVRFWQPIQTVEVPPALAAQLAQGGTDGG
jgi:hypothetical protein